MTPTARLAAAVEVLERYFTGVALERSLTGWARGARYAGSKDRAAVRDIVFQCVRCRDSYAALGGKLSARGLVFGHVICEGGTVPVAGGADRIRQAFTGERHAPEPLTQDEQIWHGSQCDSVDIEVIRDVPNWLQPELNRSLGSDFGAVCNALKSRAPVFVRVNLSRISLADAQKFLADEDIIGRAHSLANSALEIVENARRVSLSKPYQDGLIELQDAASQAVIQAAVPDIQVGNVLDYCAGGGGKTLALADRFPGAEIYAHDAAPGRMADLPDRARRAGASVTEIATSEADARGPFDLVLCDVPCSGSGAWRRAVEGKWSLTEEKLAALQNTQAEILARTAKLVRPGGYLAYITCSLLKCENTEQVQKFTAETSSFSIAKERQFSPLQGGDGFYVAILRSSV